MKAHRDDRTFYRALKHIECRNHQPFIKMEKDPRFDGYTCPECGDRIDVLVRECRLKTVDNNYGISITGQDYDRAVKEKENKVKEKKDEYNYLKEATPEKFQEMFVEWYLPAIKFEFIVLKDRIKKLEEKGK